MNINLYGDTKKLAREFEKAEKVIKEKFMNAEQKAKKEANDKKQLDTDLTNLLLYKLATETKVIFDPAIDKYMEKLEEKVIKKLKE